MKLFGIGRCIYFIKFASHVMEIVRYMSYGLLFGIPVAVTFSEKIGCPATISGPSMRPSLNPESTSDADVVWVSRLHWNKHGGKPGDMIALISPENPSQRLVKRIIGVEKNFILTRSYKKKQLLVPVGHLWVEGDNAQRSKDCNSFGPISKGLVVGTVTHIIWPPHRMQRIEHKLTPDQCSRTFVNQSHDKN